MAIFLSPNMKMHYYHSRNHHQKIITSMNLEIKFFKIKMSYFAPGYLIYVYFDLNLQFGKNCCIKSKLYNENCSAVWYTRYFVFQIKRETFDSCRCKCLDFMLLISVHSASYKRVVLSRSVPWIGCLKGWDRIVKS